MNKKEYIFIVILTFIVVIIWVIADIYHTKPSIPLDPALEGILEPLSPEFDHKVIDKIKSYTPNTPVIEVSLPQSTNSAEQLNPKQQISTSSPRTRRL